MSPAIRFFESELECRVQVRSRFVLCSLTLEPELANQQPFKDAFPHRIPKTRIQLPQPHRMPDTQTIDLASKPQLSGQINSHRAL